MLTPDDVRAALSEPGPEAFKKPLAQVKTKTPKAQERPQFGSLVEQLGAAFQEFDPEFRPIAVAQMRSQFPFLQGIPLTPEEQADAELTRSARNAQLTEQIARHKYTQTVSWLVDNAGEKVPGTDMTLQEMIQERVPGRLDASLLDDPERLVAVSREAARLTGQESLALSQGMLITGGLESAKMSPEERAQAKLQGRVKAAETATTYLQQQTAEKEGKGVGSKVIESVEQQREAAGGVDIAPSLGNSNIDTPAGAAELSAAFEQALAVGVGTFGLAPDDVIDRFIERYGEDLADQIEESPTVQDPGTGANLVVSGQGTFDVDPMAQGQLVGLAERMGSVGTYTPTQIFQKLGLPFAGSEPTSRKGFRATVTQQQP